MNIKLNLSHYASIMLDAFKDVLCSKLCWHNRPGSNKINSMKKDFLKIFDYKNYPNYSMSIVINVFIYFIMLVLYLMLSVAHYAQYYTGITRHIP